MARGLKIADCASRQRHMFKVRRKRTVLSEKLKKEPIKMSTTSDPTCGNPYCTCDQPCNCTMPCTCGLELVGEEIATKWDAEAHVLVYSIVATYAPNLDVVQREASPGKI
jgi:hypothetical protein